MEEKIAADILDRFAETMFNAMMAQHQKQATEMGLPAAQAQALRVLGRGPLCTSELAAELGVSAPAITQLTDRLTQKRLIERRTVDRDRRAVRIALTDKGRRTVAAFRARRTALFREAFAHLNEGDRASLLPAFEGLAAALERLDASAGQVTSTQANPAVYEVYEGQTDNQERQLQTPILSPPASQDMVKPRLGQAGRKVRMEWD
jgi:DNA-binding MarR family transcriptional regulator